MLTELGPGVTIVADSQKIVLLYILATSITPWIQF